MPGRECMKDRLANIDLGKTTITDKIRVSSAAIFYEASFGNYYQLETWIFSDDIRYKSRQTIHGTCAEKIPERLIIDTQTFHRRVAKGLMKKFGVQDNLHPLFQQILKPSTP